MRTVLRPVPGPSDADRAGEFSFGRLELGGPTSSRFSAMVVAASDEGSLESVDVVAFRRWRWRRRWRRGGCCSDGPGRPG